MARVFQVILIMVRIIRGAKGVEMQVLEGLLEWGKQWYLQRFCTCLYVAVPEFKR